MHACPIVQWCAGNALWLDDSQRMCLVLWHSAEQWGDIILLWARSVGMEESVTTIDELSSGDEVQGTGAMPRWQHTPGHMSIPVACCESQAIKVADNSAILPVHCNMHAKGLALSPACRASGSSQGAHLGSLESLGA